MAEAAPEDDLPIESTAEASPVADSEEQAQAPEQAHEDAAEEQTT